MTISRAVVDLPRTGNRWTPDKYDDFVAGIERLVEELGIPQPLPPLSATGVDYLFEPDVLVEVEAYAVLD
ncbi:hypothetical protein [Nocardia sp. NPDC002869]|uniref:hypothetical protein n=1 Tax=Nocardia sp. NPDC002869 TaxID=3161032 RepID=UPI00398D29CF